MKNRVATAKAKASSTRTTQAGLLNTCAISKRVRDTSCARPLRQPYDGRGSEPTGAAGGASRSTSAFIRSCLRSFAPLGDGRYRAQAAASSTKPTPVQITRFHSSTPSRGAFSELRSAAVQYLVTSA